LAAHLEQHAQDSRLVQRLFEAVATASDALAEQEVLIEQMQGGEGEQAEGDAS
jgi:hypothetical protein